MNGSELLIVPFDASHANTVLGWKYSPPYDIYNEEEFSTDLSNYFAILDEDNVLLGFFCLGHEARVKGLTEKNLTLDVGMGIRPDLTGHGNGIYFAQAIKRYVLNTETFTCIRTAIQSWNARSINLAMSMGFVLVDELVLGSCDQVTLYSILELQN